MNANPSSRKRIQSVVSQFRNYDKAMLDWVSSAPVMDDGTPVPVVFATPDRAFAAMGRLLKARGEGNISDVTPKNIPLPFISITSSSIQFDPSRYHGPVRYSLGLTQDGLTSFSTIHPVPYDIAYRIEFWAKNEEVMNVFKLWMTSSFTFGHEQFIDVNLSDIWPGWSRKIVPLRNDGMRFSGISEPEEGHRVIRNVADMSMGAWVVTDIKETKSVKKIISGIYTAKTFADIQGVTSDEVDVSPDIYDLVGTFATE